MNEELYKSLPFDLAGSRAKNRFRAELLWGIIKFYDIPNDCLIIFDYFCDIEIHFTDKYEFYQIKTDKKTASYTIDRLIKPNKSNESILGKVYVLKKIIDKTLNKSVKSCVVSNIPLNGKKVQCDPGEICFNILHKDDKKKIEERLKIELEIEKIDFDTIYFNYTTIDLKNPEYALIAKTLEYAKGILGKQPKNIEGLCALIRNEVEKKACYEFENVTYDMLVKNKSISKKQLNDLIIDFEGVSDDIVHKINKKIEKIYSNNFLKVCKIKTNLRNVISRLRTDINLKHKENSIVEFIKDGENKLEGSQVEIINVLKTKAFFDIEENEDERIAFILYVLTKFEEGYYE